jgi:hypothetical protein
MAWLCVKNSLPYIVSVTVGFTIYESLKQIFLPGISKWRSHIISIMVVALLATVFRSGYLAARAAPPNTRALVANVPDLALLPAFAGCPGLAPVVAAWNAARAWRHSGRRVRALA